MKNRNIYKDIHQTVMDIVRIYNDIIPFYGYVLYPLFMVVIGWKVLKNARK